jgi:glycosyltransferase involved in cell wall biosynthesis
MSSLARGKGIQRLIEAFALLRSRLPDTRLNIAGTWTEPSTETEVRSLLERERLGATVTFYGNVDGAAKRAFLESGALFCLPTSYPYEGQPLVLLEALAAGLPVVSTRHAAIAHTIEDGRTGRLLNTNCTAQELAATLGEVLADPVALANMSAAARQAYLSRYTLETCHTNLCAAFEA